MNEVLIVLYTGNAILKISIYSTETSRVCPFNLFAILIIFLVTVVSMRLQGGNSEQILIAKKIKF